MTPRRYHLYPEPTHSQAPNAWAVDAEIVVGEDEDGEPVIDHDQICHGIPLRVALDQIMLHMELTRGDSDAELNAAVEREDADNVDLEADPWYDRLEEHPAHERY
jgi:hypothetical protein